MSSWSLQGQHWRQLRCESKIEVSEVGTDFRTHAVAAEKGRRQPGPWNFDKFTAFTKIFGICVEIFSSTVWFNQILVALVAVAQSASASECRSIALQYGALAAVCWRQ